MESIREQLIELAIEDVENGLSQKEVALRYSIPPSTLNKRLHGSYAPRKAKEKKQRLSTSQESFIVNWALHLEAAFRPPSRRQLVGFTEAILREGGERRPLGARWYDRFLKRHPEVKRKPSRILEASRVRGSTRHAYEDFFARLDAQINEKDIKPANIANMDEHGLQELETRAGKVIGSSLTPRSYIIGPDTTTWVSIIECVTAEGKRIRPVIVFTGESLQAQWFPLDLQFQADFPHWKYDHSSTGWSNLVTAEHAA